MSYLCDNCCEPTSKLCAKCQRVAYCCKMCQMAKWHTHKSRCIDGNLRQKYIAQISSAHSKIYGNIAILASYELLDKNTGNVLVDIDETISSFLRDESMHFACISFISADEAEEIGWHPVTDHDKINVIYVLKDFRAAVKIDRMTESYMKSVTTIYKRPQKKWTVVFEI
jgi:hypothetical protein